MKKPRKHVSGVRRFRHKHGFADDTDYIECQDGKTFFISDKGERQETEFFKLETCLKIVESGDWVEI